MPLWPIPPSHHRFECEHPQALASPTVDYPQQPWAHSLHSNNHILIPLQLNIIANYQIVIALNMNIIAKNALLIPNNIHMTSMHTNIAIPHHSNRVNTLTADFGHQTQRPDHLIEHDSYCHYM